MKTEELPPKTDKKEEDQKPKQGDREREHGQRKTMCYLYPPHTAKQF